MAKQPLLTLAEAPARLDLRWTEVEVMAEWGELPSVRSSGEYLFERVVGFAGRAGNNTEFKVPSSYCGPGARSGSAGRSSPSQSHA